MNGNQQITDFTKLAISSPEILTQILAVDSSDEFSKLTSALAIERGINLDANSIRDAMVDAPNRNNAISDDQLESAAGFGYGQYACTDNSNFTAQRPSACQTCTTTTNGGCRM
jgi:hypothetical protein